MIRSVWFIITVLVITFMAGFWFSTHKSEGIEIAKNLWERITTDQCPRGMVCVQVSQSPSPSPQNERRN